MKKTYVKNGRTCRVTFEVQPEGNVQTASVCGEFNAWDTTEHSMKRRKDGCFAVTLSLVTGQQYRFRYLLDGERWENDGAADAYLPNPFGSEDSVIQVCVRSRIRRTGFQSVPGALPLAVSEPWAILDDHQALTLDALGMANQDWRWQSPWRSLHVTLATWQSQSLLLLPFA
jgi:hypothetical protein